MASRHGQAEVVEQTEEVAEVEVPTQEPDSEVETVAPEQPAAQGENKTSSPTRSKGDLPDGYVTPIGLAKAISEKAKTGVEGFANTFKPDEKGNLRPQVVYSHIRNASKSNPVPTELIKDSIGAERLVIKTDAGLEWWASKTKRVQASKEAAANKQTSNGNTNTEGQEEAPTPEPAVAEAE